MYFSDRWGSKGSLLRFQLSEVLKQPLWGRQLIAGQNGHWQMYIENNRLVANVLGVEVEAVAPEAGECSEIILTGYFDHALAFFGKKEATLALYVNRKRVDSTVINTFDLPLEGI